MAILRRPTTAGRLFSCKFVERLRECCVWRYRLKTSSTFVLMLIDCFEHYDSSVDVAFRIGFPYARRQINARNFRGATLPHVADQSVPKLDARSL
jgi:hypothetical protein